MKRGDSPLVGSRRDGRKLWTENFGEWRTPVNVEIKVLRAEGHRALEFKAEAEGMEFRSPDIQDLYRKIRDHVAHVPEIKWHKEIVIESEVDRYHRDEDELESDVRFEMNFSVVERGRYKGGPLMQRTPESGGSKPAHCQWEKASGDGIPWTEQREAALKEIVVRVRALGKRLTEILAGAEVEKSLDKVDLGKLLPEARP